MPLPPAVGLAISDAERKKLVALGRHRSSPRGIVLRLEIVLGAARKSRRKSQIAAMRNVLQPDPRHEPLEARIPGHALELRMQAQKKQRTAAL